MKTLPFSAKDIIRPFLFDLLPSPIFQAAYDASYGMRLGPYKEDYSNFKDDVCFLLDLHDDKNVDDNGMDLIQIKFPYAKEKLIEFCDLIIEIYGDKPVLIRNLDVTPTPSLEGHPFLVHTFESEFEHLVQTDVPAAKYLKGVNDINLEQVLVINDIKYQMIHVYYEDGRCGDFVIIVD